MTMGTQSGSVQAGLYDGFRTNGAPTYYDEKHTPWHADILESGFIFAGCILAFAFLTILPGVHGKSRWFRFVWIIVSVFVGTTLLVTNYSSDWETAEVVTETKYKAGTGHDITAKVGIHIGLRGINITLKGEPVHQLNETINYNEHFSWSWSQGRIGFGPYASQFNQEYRAAQFRGLPLPILWIAEYFTLDGENIRWGRLYRQAGLYAHLCLWLALASWILSNIMMFVLIRYGAYLAILTGLGMCTTNIIKHTLRAPLPLAIPFSSEHVLLVHYGAAFWLNLVTGLLCIVFGLVILILDLRLPWATSSFFGMDILQEEKLLETEKSNVSAHSSSTQASRSTNDTELTEVITESEPGSRAGHTRSNPDDVYGDDAWTDEDSSYDSELDPTDEESDDQSKVVEEKPSSRGLIQRFQRNRRVPSATPTRRVSELKRSSPPGFLAKKNRVSPDLPRWR